MSAAIVTAGRVLRFWRSRRRTSVLTEGEIEKEARRLPPAASFGILDLPCEEIAAMIGMCAAADRLLVAAETAKAEAASRAAEGLVTSDETLGSIRACELHGREMLAACGVDPEIWLLHGPEGHLRSPSSNNDAKEIR